MKANSEYRVRRALSQGKQLMEEPFRSQVPQPSWPQLVNSHSGQYLAVIATLFLLAWSERWDPFQRIIYADSDLETWRYSYPLRQNHVPAWAVPCVSMLSPVVCVLGFLLAGRISRTEAHHSMLLAVSCVATTGLLTNWIKINIGRPRPHFVDRCWPNGLKPTFTEGFPKCADGAINVAEGMKSFPSGHTSWSTSGLGFLTFWLLGKLQAFDGQAQPSRFIIAVAPLLGAVWIGMSRIQDYWHHWEDVAAGFVLGLLLAYCFYRQIYPGVVGQHAGMLTMTVRGWGRPALPGSRSSSLLYGGLEEEWPDERV